MRFDIPQPEGFAVAVRQVEFPSDSLKTSVGKILVEKGIGGYEPETLAAAVALVHRYGLSAFLDIGANIGIYSVVLKSVFGSSLHVTAYEPLPMLNEMASSIASLNGLNINVDSRAISDKSGKSKFYVSAQSDSSSSLNPTFRKHKDVIDVQLARLDDIHSDRTASLVKVDTESTEPDVFAGGAEYIERVRPWVLCDVLKGKGEERLHALFGPLGYSYYHLGREALVSSPTIRGDPTYKHRDWLFAPSGVDDAFRHIYGYWRRGFEQVRRDFFFADCG